MTDLHYEHPKLVDVYDLGNGWSEDRNFYLSLAGDKPISILDLGCGTGLLCNAYAERGHMVTGVDPAASMLEAAKKSPFGKKIEWVQASAESFQFYTKFDLIVMTGHAFQVLLDDHNVASSFVRIRDHLSREGMFAFESRNPRIDWASEWDGMQRELQSPTGRVRESFKVRSAQGDRIIFETEYAFADERLVSVSELRFMSSDRITRHLIEAGLHVHELLGDWDGSSFSPERSREMVFLVRPAGQESVRGV
jgi:SAM-dependent methyltransferase